MAEIKAWQLHYGKFCNHKYCSEMEGIFDFITDLTKRLSRPIKDLDDIRFAMAALKEIRENEIRIDMSISPIEVCNPSWMCDKAMGSQRKWFVLLRFFLYSISVIIKIPP